MEGREGALAGRHVLVTGGGTGIGAAIAGRLAAAGARVSLLARDLARLEKVAADLDASADGNHFCVSCDVVDREAVEAAVAAAAAACGPLYACVANAGVGGPNSPGDEGGDRWDELVATNLSGTYHTLQAARSVLLPSGEARHLVVVSSILARIGVPGYSGYCASKAGLLGLVRALAAELAADEVQVNAVCPGWVNTSMAREGLEGMAQALGTDVEEARAMAMSEVPMGRMSEPADVAGMVAWLLSGDARGVTGQSLDMNGGAFMG
jgi:NAD(P)-dependent dehydrogenase (short-subunit alcohol dehydrogenase family)